MMIKPIFLISVGVAVALAPNLFEAGATPNTETEEAQNLINVAETQFYICNEIKGKPYSSVIFYQKEECDHNVLFLKGICESTNNTAYDWCFNTDMVRYMNDRDINNAPRPPDVWCNMFIDKCISMHEALKIETIEVSSDTDVDFSGVVDSLDETIEELEQKKAALEE